MPALTPSLERPRLNRLLPEEGGYAVCLEAPYGYGKSVLLGQWAILLKRMDWRVVRLERTGPDPLRSIATILGCAPHWQFILERLNSQPTALMLEDLSDAVSLGPLLKPLGGLLLLESRRPLEHPELLRLSAAGRCVRLEAKTLAFTLEETQQLFGTRAGAEPTWKHTRGWALPLGLHARGQDSAEVSLWREIWDSLDLLERRELLFIAACTPLPLEAAGQITHRLEALGWALPTDEDEAGYTLPPLLREMALAYEAGAALQAVRLEEGRLEPRVRGKVLERWRMNAELRALLEETPGIGQDAPQEVIRWDALTPVESVPGQLEVAWAYARTGYFMSAGERFERVARDPQTTIEQRLEGYGNAAFYWANVDFSRCPPLVEAGEALLEQVTPFEAANFLNRASHADYMAGQLEQGVIRLERGLTLLPASQDRASLRTKLRGNLAMQRWWLFGDTDALLAVRKQDFLERGPGMSGALRVQYHYTLGVLQMMSGLIHEARSSFQGALEDADFSPLQALNCEALLVLLEDRFESMPALWARIEGFQDPDSEDRVLAFWLLALVNANRVPEALERMNAVTVVSGSFVEMVRALVLFKAGQTSAALEALPQPRDPQAWREQMLLAYATRYRVTGEMSELEALTQLNLERERVLAFFVPVTELPRTHPQLTRFHPIAHLLESGWKEAIRLRLDEVPPLELHVLGGFEVCLLGQNVALTARPRDLMVLLALRVSREQMAERLWPDVNPEKSRNNLHVNLNALRKVVEPWGVPTYLLERGLERTHCDLWDLQAALERADSSQVRRLYADLAPGLEFEGLLEARESLREQVFDYLLTQPNEENLEWILKRDPLNENALLALLETLMTSGRGVTARRHYRQYARRLKSELGLEPDVDLKRVLEG